MARVVGVVTLAGLTGVLFQNLIQIERRRRRRVGRRERECETKTDEDSCLMKLPWKPMHLTNNRGQLGVYVWRGEGSTHYGVEIQKSAPGLSLPINTKAA